MRRLILISFILALLVVGGALWYFYGNLKVNIDIPPSADKLAAEEKIHLSINPSRRLPLAKLEILLVQGNKKLQLYKGDLKSVDTAIEVKTKDAGFKNGKAQIVAYLELPFKREIIFQKEVYIDTTPPKVMVLEKPHRLVIGEPGVVAVKTSPDTTNIYVELGKAHFQLLNVGNNTFKTVITAPLFLLKHPESYFVVAKDEAGNISKVYLPILVKPKKFRTVKMKLSKEKLEEIVLKFFPNPDNPIKRFEEINTLFREEDENRIRKICSNSEAKLMAEKSFLQLPGSMPTAYYGDHRYYYYNGKLIGESIHKGIDLAKYRHAPVVAANNGKVVFVGTLKIYGNTVIIDHGFGVFTLYGHLNDFAVHEGEYVKKGQLIGHTDTTGLALGDHLHFGVLVWGYAANPIFFFDGYYLHYYFYQPLKKISF